jgi:DNA invertase Pin-like site-specific DNA recombinase
MKPQSPIRKAAVYGRVSTNEKKQDVRNQLHQLRAYCKRQRWSIVREYIDHASAKRSDNRKEFLAMLTDASRRRFDVVVVWALDRFSREGIKETFSHVAKLKDYGVQFESYTEPQFRTTGQAGDLMLAVAAWIAKQERIRISERTRAGLARVRREGTKSGKPIGRPTVESKVDFDIARAREMRRAGKSFRQIAKELNVSHATVLYRLAA